MEELKFRSSGPGCRNSSPEEKEAQMPEHLTMRGGSKPVPPKLKGQHFLSIFFSPLPDKVHFYLFVFLFV